MHTTDSQPCAAKQAAFQFTACGSRSPQVAEPKMITTTREARMTSSHFEAVIVLSDDDNDAEPSGGSKGLISNVRQIHLRPGVCL